MGPMGQRIEISGTRIERMNGDELMAKCVTQLVRVEAELLSGCIMHMLSPSSATLESQAIQCGVTVAELVLTLYALCVQNLPAQGGFSTPHSACCSSLQAS